jgi:hypothetical protein
MKQLKPFNLEQALAGKPVMTREGRKVVRIFYAEEACENSQVICVFETGVVFPYYKDGAYTTSSSVNDLVMAPTKKEGYVVMFYNNSQKDFLVGTKIWASREDAEIWSKGCEAVFAIAKIEWEE